MPIPAGFEHIVRENRSVLGLLKSDHTWLNERPREMAKPARAGFAIQHVEPLASDRVDHAGLHSLIARIERKVCRRVSIMISMSRFCDVISKWFVLCSSSGISRAVLSNIRMTLRSQLPP